MHSPKDMAQWYFRRALAQLEQVPHEAPPALDWVASAVSLAQMALALVRDGGKAFLDVEPLTPALPWRYALDDEVQYTPYARGEHPECWPADKYTVVGRHWTELKHTQRPAERYVIQPDPPAGHWCKDAPLTVFVEQLTLWEGHLSHADTP